MGRILFGLGTLSLFFAISATYILIRLPAWQNYVQTFQTDILNTPQNALNPSWWEQQNKQAQAVFPAFYPFSTLHKSLQSAQRISKITQTLQKTSLDGFLDESQISNDLIDSILPEIYEISREVQTIEKQIKHLLFWSHLAGQGKQATLKQAQSQIQQLSITLQQILLLENYLKKLQTEKEWGLVLLQNQNEPRSTGGFVGSIIIVSFEAGQIHWDFQDIYASDRQIQGPDQPVAPAWFHDLSQTISLRDANFWPDFPTSAQTYQKFFAQIDTAPDFVIGLNLRLVQDVVDLVDPIHLPTWDLELTAQNFDLLLQLLVESKVAGRFAPKKPVDTFAQVLFQKLTQGQIDLQALKKINWNYHKQAQNILIHSSDTRIQKLISKWSLSGQINPQEIVADDQLQFDFVSIGANKSEKFIWTKVEHDSNLSPQGDITNTLRIKRTHALKTGELDQALQTNSWQPNIKQLLTPELRWKLGEGENRTILRLSIPKSAQIKNYQNQSGSYSVETESLSNELQTISIPMFVKPGESLEIEIIYSLQNTKGSHAWRPYSLQLIGTPGKTQSTFTKTISSTQKAQFQKTTENIGLPQPLWTQEFRSILRFSP